MTRTGVGADDGAGNDGVRATGRTGGVTGLEKVVGTVVALALAGGALALAYAAGASPSVIAGTAAGALCLLWLLALLTLPWNLYFRAHTVLAEIEVSRGKGLVIDKARDAEAGRIARLMLRAAVAGHVLTAGAVVAVTVATGHVLGWWLAGFFLLSTLFRPAGAYFGQLRRRLGTLMKDVTFPRDDVVELRKDVTRVKDGTKVLEEKAEEQYRALAELRRVVDALGTTVYARADEADRKIAALGREFEATVNRLTDNQEIITGLKAFLRLLRSPDAADGGSAALP